MWITKAWQPISPEVSVKGCKKCCISNGMDGTANDILMFFWPCMYRLVSNYQLNAQFLYSVTIYMLRYNPRHVSSSTVLIFRRTDCITAASGIITLCKWPYSMPVENGLQSALNQHIVQPFTESDDTRCCNNTICPPEDDHSTARNMSRIIL